MNSVAEIHAALRQAGGCNLDQMVSEYRALRASVTRLWGAEASEPVAENVADLIRFNSHRSGADRIDKCLFQKGRSFARSVSGHIGP